MKVAESDVISICATLYLPACDLNINFIYT